MRESNRTISTLQNAEFIHVFPSSMENAKHGSVPVLLYPHGGPHVASTTAFTISSSFFAKLGYAVVLINYRGSLGFGKAFVDSLIGHVGDYDIKDCIDSLKALLAKHPQLSSDRVFVYAKCTNPFKLVSDGISTPSSLLRRFGGSHGGWIAAHFATRAEEVGVKATCLVNPVTNIAHNYGIRFVEK